jgi:hypothetical protein
MCISPYAYVLAFYKYFQGVRLALLLDPNAYAQEDDLVALDHELTVIALS